MRVLSRTDHHFVADLSQPITATNPADRSSSLDDRCLDRHRYAAYVISPHADAILAPSSDNDVTSSNYREFGCDARENETAISGSDGDDEASTNASIMQQPLIRLRAVPSIASSLEVFRAKRFVIVV